jgi:thioredoxin-like negative regulator of GroEL
MTTPNSHGAGAPSSMNLHGAVDLAALKNRAERAAKAPEQDRPAGGNPYVVDVTEQSFQQVVQLSAQVPVVVVLTAAWSGQSAEVEAALDRLAAEQDGNILVARADIEAQPQIAQAFQAQGAPTVVAVVKGQPVPLFQGALPEDQIRSFVEELLKVAEANGVNGSLKQDGDAPDGAQDAPQEAALPPLHQAAFDAIEAGDYAAAAAAYRQALAEQPGDAEARAGLGQVELMQRLEGADAAVVRGRAADHPDDLDAQLAVADLDLAGGHVEDAFNRLISLIGRAAGPERETARVRLVELFDVVGPADPRVTKARGALARVLF